jgi:hypothetical protein
MTPDMMMMMISMMTRKSGRILMSCVVVFSKSSCFGSVGRVSGEDEEKFVLVDLSRCPPVHRPLSLKALKYSEVGNSWILSWRKCPLPLEATCPYEMKMESPQSCALTRAILS